MPDEKVLDQMVIYESLKIWYLIGSLLTLPKAFWPQQPQYSSGLMHYFDIVFLTTASEYLYLDSC